MNPTLEDLKTMSVCPTLDDIRFVPQYSDIESRSEVSLKTDLGNGIALGLPIVASPMDTVTGHQMVADISKLGGLGILHRYTSVEAQVAEIEAAKKQGATLIGAAVGTNGDYLERAGALVGSGVQVLCVDVAHGHHILMKKALGKLREKFGDGLHIMAGNVATAEGFEALEAWGADSVRAGIGGGSACSTQIQTGHGLPNLITALECSRTAKRATVILDGGIKNAGDVVKALGLGCHAVMMGSLLAGTDSSPSVLYKDATTGMLRKGYRGMASRSAQLDWRKKSSAAEGVVGSVPYVGSLEDFLGEMAGNIRSGLSYTGARTIPEFQKKAKFVLVSPAAHAEGKPHVLTRG